MLTSRQNLNLHLTDIIKVQEYEENEFLQLIKEEQQRTRKPVDIVDVRKKFHLKQLQKKSKINTIFGTTSSIVTLIILIVTAFLLYKFCIKGYRQQGNNICHFNRIEERVQLQEMPEMRKPAQSIVSNTTVSTDAEEIKGTPINLSDIIRNES